MNIIEQHWDAILQHLKQEHELSDVSFNTWLKPLTVHSYKNNVLTILVPTKKMGRDYITTRYSLPLKVSICEITGETCEINLVLPEELGDEEPKAPVEEEAAHVFPENNLIKDYTFDTFVVGNNNQFAHAASLAVAESPGEIYNPLFLYSGVGLGKTHLMHSIAHFIMKNNPKARVLYVTSEKFTTDLIDSIRNNNSSDFREKYRNVDVLLVDDIQFITGKESTQEEFFHTFNTLYDAKKQIIISSDKPPRDMEILEDRIKSRFEWGLICDISAPDFETRMAILRKKQEMDGYNVGDQVIEYIASNIKSNIRELEGAITKVRAFASLTKRQIDVELAEQVLKDMISPNTKRELTPDVIISMVAEHFSVTASDIMGPKRNSTIVYPRQIAMYLCNDILSMPLTKIGKAFGKRDHSTIIHGCKKIQEQIDVKESVRNDVDALKKKLNY